MMAAEQPSTPMTSQVQVACNPPRAACTTGGTYTPCTIVHPVQWLKLPPPRHVSSPKLVTPTRASHHARQGMEPVTPSSTAISTCATSSSVTCPKSRCSLSIVLPTLSCPVLSHPILSYHTISSHPIPSYATPRQPILSSLTGRPRERRACCAPQGVLVVGTYDDGL